MTSRRWARRQSVFATGIAVACSLSRVGAQAPKSEPGPATLALVESYADGRVNCELIAERPGKMWTPWFPRIEGWQQPPDALPAVAVEFARALAGEDVLVDVSVHLGRGHQEIRPIETVRLKRGDRAVIRTLTAYGIKPIVLSLADAEPLMPFLPTVMSASPEIEITDVSLRDAPYPGYRITLRNLSTRSVSNFHVQSYRGERKALSLLPRGQNGQPVMVPGGTHTFDLNLTSGSGRDVHAGAGCTPEPLDLIDIDAVLWEGGAFEGQPPFPQSQAAIEVDAGRRLQLTRVIAAIRQTLAGGGSPDELLQDLQSRIEALPDVDRGQLRGAQQSMLATKAAAMADVRRFAEGAATQSGPRAVRDWLEYTAKRYQAWVDRLVGR